MQPFMSKEEIKELSESGLHKKEVGNRHFYFEVSKSGNFLGTYTPYGNHLFLIRDAYGEHIDSVMILYFREGKTGALRHSRKILIEHAREKFPHRLEKRQEY